jgi:uncharacterized protein YjbI with pentapeptide repeats
MANQEHLDLLTRGVAEWNAWRAANRKVVPDLREADLREADLGGAELWRADLQRANLREADLGGADLGGAELWRADLSYADLRLAHLTLADLHQANLTKTDLRGVQLQWAHLTLADLQRAHLEGADLNEAKVGGTIFGDTDLSGVKGLETVRHDGPSTIGIDTLYRSGGNIPEVFLRGCGVPDSFIDYIPLLIGAIQPVQYYSCFISYSTKDDDFAHRLHERMRAEHLRVWFAPEDIKGGDKLYDQIERAIQLHDRLLLVLSEQSIQSEWVMTEIRNARRVERKEQRRKLFPIRLIEMEQLRSWSCFDADSGKDLAVEVREYFIPDFSHWKEHDAFEAAFARLLRDLRAAEHTPPARGQQ